MKEKQTKIDSIIVTKKLKEPILDGCIHIYPGKKVAIGLARNFFELIKELGVDRWKRTQVQKYDHPDLPVIVGILDNVFSIAIYADDIGYPTSKMHNFMITNIPKNESDALREMFKTTTRMKAVRTIPIPERYPRVYHIRFNLDEAEVVGMVQGDVRDFFQ